MVDQEALYKEILVAAIRNYQLYLRSGRTSLDNQHKFLTQTAIIRQLWVQTGDQRGYRSKSLLATSFRELEKRNWLKSRKGKHKALLYYPTDLGSQLGGEYFTQERLIADIFAGKQSYLLDPKQKSSSHDISDMLQALRYHFEHQLSGDSLIGTISGRFVAFSDFAEVTHVSLADIGKYLGADRTFLVLFHKPKTWLPNSYEWCSSGIHSALSKLDFYQADRFPWALKDLGDISHIWIQEGDSLIDEKPNEKDFLWDQGASSLLILPLFVEEAFRGVLGVADLPGNRGPAQEDVTILRVCCEIMGASVARLETNYALTRRVKELNCLYEISEIVRQSELSLRKILKQVVKLLPAAWQYPEIAGACITLNKEQYATSEYKNDGWTQTADIISRGNQVGAIIVSYNAKRPDGGAGEGPFLREERQLLDVIVEWLGQLVERKRADAVLQE